MIVVRLKRLVISLVIIILVTLLLVVSGLSINGGKSWSLDLELQNFFFWGLAALIIQVWVGVSLLLNHKKILKTIRRLTSFDEIHSANAEKAFREMGSLGEEIKKVLKHENQLSAMRSERISALNSLAGSLCEGYSEPVAVTDVNGVLFAISNKLKSRILKDNEGKLIGNILELRSDLKLSEILVFMEKQRASWKESEDSGIICTPVFDRNNSVQFCIWEFETSFFAGKLKDLNQQKSKVQPTYSRIKAFINPLLKRK